MTTARERVARLRATGIDEAYRTGELAAMADAFGDEPEHRHVDRRAIGAEVPAFTDGGPRRITVYNLVSAGAPHEWTDRGLPAGIADEYVWLSGVSDPEVFACRITGDSMEPEYRGGDLVVFAPSLTPVSGQDCFIRFVTDEESTFKRVHFSHQDNEAGTFELEPLNPTMRPRTVTREEVAALAVAVSLYRRMRARTGA